MFFGTRGQRGSVCVSGPIPVSANDRRDKVDTGVYTAGREKRQAEQKLRNEAAKEADRRELTGKPRKTFVAKYLIELRKTAKEAKEREDLLEAHQEHMAVNA